MTIDNPNQFKASAALTQAILTNLATSRGVHAETAVSAAARMAGTLLLRSSGLPIDQLEPGSAIFSDLMDERGEQLLGAVGHALASLNVPFDPRRVTFEVPDANNPHLGLMEVQSLLDGHFAEILRKHRLNGEEGAYAAAISTAVLIQKCSSVLDPHVGYAIAANGMVEACKTIPVAVTV